MELREYQNNIINTAKEKNTLVILPTGLGKTLIAFELIKYMLEKRRGKAIFLAPTKPLVDQHFSNFKKNYQFETHILTGSINPGKRKEIFEKAEVILATPQTVANDMKNNLINLYNVCIIIFDEAHRCLKNYDYVYIAKKYVEENKSGRIVGLTASPSEEKAKIDQICHNLNISAIEIRTRESPDVKPYIKKLKVKIIKTKIDDELEEIRKNLKEYYEKKLEELKNRGFLFKPIVSKKDIIELQRTLQRKVAIDKNYNLLKAMTAIAVALKIQHALELLETQSISALYLYLQDLYEQAQEKKSKAVCEIIRNGNFNKAFLKTVELYKKGREHPKLEKLKEILQEELKNNKNFRAIVFTQYRDNVAKISDVLSSFGIKNKPFVGQAKKRDFGLNQKIQREIIEEFKLGLINVLVSTSVGEEGLDLPEVDTVIFYEPVPSAIRKIQRAGRTARTREGRVIILMTEKTRDESYYWAAWHKEHKMYNIINSLSKKLKLKEPKQTVEKTKAKTLHDFFNADIEIEEENTNQTNQNE
ncbi:MAG: helicase-related protein [Candidatus Pacearchaeota archaeon]